MKHPELNVYPLFVAMTRAPMLMGVTHTFFVMNFVVCFSAMIITKNIIITGGVFLILHAIGVFGCRYDERYFEIALGRLELYCPNKKIWGCNSYDPE